MTCGLISTAVVGMRSTLWQYLVMAAATSHLGLGITLSTTFCMTAEVLATNSSNWMA